MNLENKLLKEFTREEVASLDEIIARYRKKPGALIPVLEEIQQRLRYLPPAVQQRVAEGLKVPLSRVYGVVTFYSFFTMKPRGKHTIRTCLGTACYVLGGKGIAETVERELKVKHGDTTADRLFTFEVVRCIGACGLAPAVVVDEVVHGKVKASNIMQILSKFS